MMRLLHLLLPVCLGLLGGCADEPAPTSRPLTPADLDRTTVPSETGGGTQGLRSVGDDEAPAEVAEEPPVPDLPDDWDREQARENPVAAMHSLLAKLRSRAEDPAEVIETRHILIGIKGAPTMLSQLSPEEAETLAAAVLHDLKLGAPWDEVQEKMTNERGASRQVIKQNTGKGRSKDGSVSRTRVQEAFGNIAWRLRVGEIGIVPYHKKRSRFGWYVVQRLK